MPGKQGFASMSPEKRRAVGSKGGKRAHQLGTSHRWTRETARAAGKKGGSLSKRGRVRKDN
jgi:general stress protein YciG